MALGEALQQLQVGTSVKVREGTTADEALMTIRGVAGRSYTSGWSANQL